MYSYFRHPNRVCMSYYQHLKTSFYYSSQLFIGSIKAFIHAIIPSLFITSTTEIVNDINNKLNINNCI